jgi:lipopolysaccharide export LptBFGC system permease protein LptF
VRILPRRFLASYLAWLAACVGGLLLALAIVDMLVDFDAVVEGGAPGLRALLERVPARWLREALPVASFAAAFLAVALPARRGELLAVRAAGIHPARVTLPIVGAALAVGAPLPWLPEAPGAAAALLEPADGARDGSAWRHAGGRVYRIGRIDPATAGLRDLRVFEVDAAFRLRRSLRADAARLSGAGLELGAAESLRFDPARPRSPARRELAPPGLPLPAGVGGPERAAGRGPVRTHAAAPAAVAVLALLAVPLGLGVAPAGGIAGRSLAALACAALFRGAWQLAAFAAERGPGASALAPALVLGAFAILAASLWARAPR